MFGKNSKGIGAIMAVVLALAFMAMPIAQVQAQEAQSTGITGAVENVGSALGGMVEGLTNTLSSDFIMSIVESISMRIGRVFGAGLFVASTDNIFFRVLEWIVAFSLLIVSFVTYLGLDLIYLIPIVSCAGVVTQPFIAHFVMLPLAFGLPFIFTESTEGGFGWITAGTTGFAQMANIVGFIINVVIAMLEILQAISYIIPCVNIIGAGVTFVIGLIAMVIGGILLIIESAYTFITSAMPSICTDCVIISRAMCRAACGV